MSDYQHPTIKIKTSIGDITCELYEDRAPNTVANIITLAEAGFYKDLIFHRIIENFMAQAGCPHGLGSGDPGYKIADEMNADSLGLADERAVTDGYSSQRLMIQSQEDFESLIMRPAFKALDINSQEDLEAKQIELEKYINKMSVKDVFAALGYNYSTEFESLKPLKGYLAMANSGPDTNGSQFFINFADTDWLTGKHTVFGKIIAGEDTVEKLEALGSESGTPSEEVTFDVEVLSKNDTEYTVVKM